MNVHESEKLAGILSSRGFSSCDDVSDADIIILNRSEERRVGKECRL